MGLGELLLCPPPLDLALARQLLALPKKGQRSALSSVEGVATSTASWQLRRRNSLVHSPGCLSSSGQGGESLSTPKGSFASATVSNH